MPTRHRPRLSMKSCATALEKLARALAAAIAIAKASVLDLQMQMTAEPLAPRSGSKVSQTPRRKPTLLYARLNIVI